MPYRDPAKRRAYLRQYAADHKTERQASAKASYRRRKKKPGYRQRHNELAKGWRRTPKGKECELRRNTYPGRKTYMRDYYHTPSGNDAFFRYRQSPKGREAKFREVQRR